MTPTLTPSVDWLTTEALVAMLNASPCDFAVRTFLGSRMHIEVGDVRHLVIPVLSDTDAERLTALGAQAIAAKASRDSGEEDDSLEEIEAEVDAVVRHLYGIGRDASLWVVR